MKKFSIILMSLALFSCANKIEPTQLLGSWKLRDVVNKTDMDISDRMIFCKNDSVCVEIFMKGKLVNKMPGKYKLDSITETLTTIYNEKFSSNFKIMKLTEEELELKNPLTKEIDRYVRY